MIYDILKSSLDQLLGDEYQIWLWRHKRRPLVTHVPVVLAEILVVSTTCLREQQRNADDDQASIYRGAYFRFWGAYAPLMCSKKKGLLRKQIGSFIYQDNYFSDPKCPIYR